MAFQPHGGEGWGVCVWVKASLLTREAETENQICPVKSCCCCCRFFTQTATVLGKEAAGTVCSGSVWQNLYAIIYTAAITPPHLTLPPLPPLPSVCLSLDLWPNNLRVFGGEPKTRAHKVETQQCGENDGVGGNTKPSPRCPSL